MIIIFACSGAVDTANIREGAVDLPVFDMVIVKVQQVRPRTPIAKGRQALACSNVMSPVETGRTLGDRRLDSPR